MRLPLLIAASLLWAGSAAAQAPAPAAPASIAGAWEGSLDHEGSVWHVAFVLQQADTLITGTLYKDGEEYGAVTGAMHGAHYAFHWEQIPFEGTVEGDRLQVEMTVFNGTKYRFRMQRRSGGP